MSQDYKKQLLEAKNAYKQKDYARAYDLYSSLILQSAF